MEKRTWVNTTTCEVYTFSCETEGLTRLQARAKLAYAFLEIAGLDLTEWEEVEPH